MLSFLSATGLNWMLRIHQVPVLLRKLIARYPSNFDVNP